MIPKLHYISQGSSPKEHLENIQQACSTGTELVQLRLKNVSEKKYLKFANEAKEITSLFHVKNGRCFLLVIAFSFAIIGTSLSIMNFVVKTTSDILKKKVEKESIVLLWSPRAVQFNRLVHFQLRNTKCV